jgi:hypothetical protein
MKIVNFHQKDNENYELSPTAQSPTVRSARQGIATPAARGFVALAARTPNC